MMLIYKKIPEIMKEVGAIEKTRQTTQGNGYSFRGIDDLYFTMQPLLAKHGVFYAPSVLSELREERSAKSGGALIYTILRMKFTFFAEDGSNFEVSTIGEAMDSGDKSSNKAMSAALKYALIQVFCIPTQEDNDTENHAPEPKPRAPLAIVSPAQPDNGMISPAQLKRLFAIQAKMKMSDEVLKNMCAAMGITTRSAIPREKYESICTLIENWKP